MKEFYGNVSLTARITFLVKAEDKESAGDVVFDDIEGIELVLKDGTTLEIAEINWDLIAKEGRENASEPNVSDFEIEEEK